MGFDTVWKRFMLSTTAEIKRFFCLPRSIAAHLAFSIRLLEMRGLSSYENIMHLIGDCAISWNLHRKRH
ncbi:hypothetical protein CCACVL1_10777 [Corchorus capsularis]|uniref:Uncharacterized protein n=1 Tax=Corchorus capsularis TaxID=210143 RepID=A0A1R3IPM4_COCAP|nr:hypothetical protein CCACVL1_10777 [Corchorus capsularis]